MSIHPVFVAWIALGVLAISNIFYGFVSHGWVGCAALILLFITAAFADHFNQKSISERNQT